MDELRQLLFEKGRVGRVLEALRKPQPPDPAADPCRALLYGHALFLYGDFQQALKVYSVISPEPSYEPERLWGLANTHLRLGNLKQVKPLLDAALTKDPSPWLLPRLYNTLSNLYIYQGRFKQALSAIMKGIEEALAGHHLTEQLILEGNRGVVQSYQGNFEEAVFSLERSINQLLVRDCILSAANFLINLSGSLEALGNRTEAGKCLHRAESLIQESGSRGRLIFLNQVQGEFLEREGFLDKAKLTYEETLQWVQEFPNPKLEAELSCDLAHLYFEKGDLGAALSLIRKILIQVREKGLGSVENLCLAYQGKFLVRGGAIQEGIAILDQACELAESQGRWDTYSYIALNLAFSYDELNQGERALEWLEKSFLVAERCRMLPSLLVEKDILISLLLNYGEKLPPIDFLSQLVVQLRHPALLKRLLKHSPESKVLFLRTLKVHDARHFQPQLKKLKDDPHREVRRTSRFILHGWHHHASYRAYTLGTLRVFLEGKMITDKDWIRPGAKRLFLFLASHPEEWLSTDTLLETLWTKPHPKRTLMVLAKVFSYLRTVFEPWHLPGMDYGFFKSQRGAYGFFPGERFWMDSWKFEEKAKHAEKAHLHRNFKEARKAYREALDLYLGDYLEEFPYEDWLNQKRDYLRETYFRSALRYAQLERDSGNLPEGRRVLEEALFKDLSRSGCAALLIQILTQMKLTHEAKEWGQRHIAYMKKELKEKPAPEVVEALIKLR